MVSLKKNRQSGFTIVELLIVIVIIGILAGLVVTQILGATASARDTERKTDLGQISNQLEGYYAKAGGYPSASDLGTRAWRTGNQISMGDSDKSLYDPSINVPGTPAVTYALGSSDTPSAVGAYNYVPLPASCVSPTDATGTAVSGTACTSYTLATYLESSGGSVFTKKNSN